MWPVKRPWASAAPVIVAPYSRTIRARRVRCFPAPVSTVWTAVTRSVPRTGARGAVRTPSTRVLPLTTGLDARRTESGGAVGVCVGVGRGGGVGVGRGGGVGVGRGGGVGVPVAG